MFQYEVWLPIVAICLVTLLIIFVTRELIMWYWKINTMIEQHDRIIENAQETNKLLKNIRDLSLQTLKSNSDGTAN